MNTRARRLAACLAIAIATPAGVARADDAPADRKDQTPPAADRLFVSPSALTQPRGTVSLKLNGVVPSIAFAPVGFLEVEGAGLWLPRPKNFHLLIGLAKLHILRSAHLHGSLIGVAADFRPTSYDQSTFWGGGAALTGCLTASCSTWASVMGGAGHKSQTQDTSPSSSSGWFAGASAHVPVIARLYVTGEAIRVDDHRAFYSLGLRIETVRLAFDVGIISLQSDIGLPSDNHTLPWAGVTYALHLY